MHSVLFICSMNICRSPMAVGLLKAAVAAADPDHLDDWRVESAGVWAHVGYPPAANTLLTLRKRGVDLDEHGSRPITLDLMQEFNLVLTMEGGQKEALQAAFPDQAAKVYMVTELMGQKYDIDDPVGGPLRDFEETASELEYIFRTQLDKIRSLSQGDRT